MSTRRIWTGIAAAIIAVGALTLPARAAGDDDGFKAFWKQFTASVEKGDQKAVAPMLKYPILAGGDQRKIEEFPLIWKDWFQPASRKCLAKAKPAKDMDPQGGVSYFVNCGEQIYSFNMESGAWKLAEFGVND